MTAMETLEEEALVEQLEELQVNERESESRMESTQNIDSLPSLDEVEEILGYRFNTQDFSNGRLEFVGDCS
ncbi:hypothetical protein REPUB_Repub17cG0022900 [Reevesia pubescens]